MLRAIGLENIISSHWPTIYFIGNINSSVVHLHESVGQLLSPHTAIFQRLDGLEYIGIQQHQKMFALQVHDSMLEDQTIPFTNVSGIFLCVDVLMSNIDEKKIMKELAELLQCYCIRCVYLQFKILFVTSTLFRIFNLTTININIQLSIYFTLSLLCKENRDMMQLILFPIVLMIFQSL